MKVKELIEELEKFNQNLEVFYPGNREDTEGCIISFDKVRQSLLYKEDCIICKKCTKEKLCDKHESIIEFVIL